MGISLTLWTPDYGYIGAMEYESAEIGQREREIGKGGISGARGVDPQAFFTRDALVVATVYDRGAPDQRTLWFVRRPMIETVSRTDTVSCSLVDANDILRRRIIAYAAGSSQSQKSMQAAAMLVEMVREQFTTATDTTRLAPLTVPDAPAYGSTQQQSFAHDTLIDALRDVCQTEIERGTWLGFDVAPANFDGAGIAGLALTFNVLAGLRGIDRRGQLLLSAATGSLKKVKRWIDYRDEATRVYAGGAGQEEARVVASATRADVSDLGPFGLIEDWIDATQVKTASYLTAKAEAELQERTARWQFSAPIAFGSDLVWNRDIGYGDIVSVEIDDRIVDARVEAYGASRDPERGTQIEAVVEGYL